MKCVEKIAEYLNYACRHHRFRIFFTATIWYKRSLSIQNRAEPVLRTQSEEGLGTIATTVRKVRSVPGPIRCAHRATRWPTLLPWLLYCVLCCAVPYVCVAVVLCCAVVCMCVCAYAVVYVCVFLLFCGYFGNLFGLKDRKVKVYAGHLRCHFLDFFGAYVL